MCKDWATALYGLQDAPPLMLMMHTKIYPTIDYVKGWVAGG
jgi:hypothetical protein